MFNLCIFVVQNSFAMDPITGIITVNQLLDRDYVVEMSFDIEARDEAIDAIRPNEQIATSKKLSSSSLFSLQFCTLK